MEKLIYKLLSSKINKLIVILLVIFAMVGAMLMIPSKVVLARMLPGKSANTFTIYVDTASNASIRETKEVTTCIVDTLKKEKVITDMEVFLGQGAPLDYAGLVKGSELKRLQNQAEIVINLTDKHERDEPSFLMVHRLRPLVHKNCGNLSPNTSIKFTEMPSYPPTLATIVVELYGKDDMALREMAIKISNILKETEGLVDVDIMQDDIYRKYAIVPDIEKIIKSGLNVEQVNKIIYLAFKGMEIAVKNTREQQDQIPIFVRLDDETRILTRGDKDSLLTKLNSLELMNRRGAMVAIPEVATVVSSDSHPGIFRKTLKIWY